jgi:hypothetical protein
VSTGYGRDTYCYDRIYTGRLASGVELLAQAIYRRLTTPRGTLVDGDEGLVYGLDVSGFVGMVGTQSAVDALPGAVEAEVLKDDRISSVTVTASVVTDSAGLSTITIDILAVPVDEGETFTLSLSVSDVTVALLGVSVQ